MSIEKQMKLADKILDRLTLISPHCILAGGAPRDWYFGNEANDLDFYFTSAGTTTGRVYEQLRRLFGDKFTDQRDINQSDLYTHMRFLRCIFDMEFNSTKVQLMLLDKPGDEYKVVDHMSVSICKAWYKFNNIRRESDFILSEKTKILFLSDGYFWDAGHPKKILTRFKTKYTTGTKEQAKERLIQKTLREENIR